jgi:hypothetical protein
MSTPAPAATEFTCGLCGEVFTHGGQVCGSCPMSNGCDLVKCPSCGFQFPRGSRIAEGLARVWGWLRKTA